MVYVVHRLGADRQVVIAVKHGVQGIGASSSSNVFANGGSGGGKRQTRAGIGSNGSCSQYDWNNSECLDYLTK